MTTPKTKKEYQKPQITKRILKLDEIVMTKCKQNTVGFTGPGGSKCKATGQACNVYGNS